MLKDLVPSPEVPLWVTTTNCGIDKECRMHLFVYSGQEKLHIGLNELLLSGLLITLLNYLYLL